MKRYYLDIGDEELIQILDLHREESLNKVMVEILKKNKVDLMMPISNEIKKKHKILQQK